MSTNWQTMDAGRELDRLIAERAGWSVVQIEGQYFLLSPEELKTAYLDMDKPSGWLGKLTEEIAWGAAPDYSTSVDSALTLLEGIWWNLVKYKDGTFIAFLRSEEGHEHTPLGGDVRMPALAICRAWLAWKESEGK